MRTLAVLLCFAAVSLAMNGMWVDLFEYPFEKCPKVMTAITCLGDDDCYVPASKTGLDGYTVMHFDGQPDGQFTPLTLPSKALTMFAIALGGDAEDPHGCAGGVGIDLAKVLNGEVGASRAAVDAGFADRSW